MHQLLTKLLCLKNKTQTQSSIILASATRLSFTAQSLFSLLVIMSAAVNDDLSELVLMKIVLELLTPAEPMTLTQRTPGVPSNPG